MEQSLERPKLRTKCNGCGVQVKSFKYLHKLNGGYYCLDCVKKKKEQRHEILIKEVLGLTKEQEVELKKKEADEYQKLYLQKPEDKEYTKKYHREYQRKKRLEAGIIPRTLRKETKIPNIKGSKNRSKSNKLHLYLTSEESKFLYNKLINLGYPTNKASERIKTMREYLSNMVKKMREEKKSDLEINTRFKKEFFKLVEGFK